MFLLRRSARIPHDTLPRIDRTVEESVLKGAAQAELREFVAEIGGLLEETKGIGFVADDGGVALWRFVQQSEFVERVRVFGVCALRGAFEPSDSFALAARLPEEAFELYHAHLVHSGCIAEHGSAFVPLDSFHGVFSRAAAFFVAEFAADGGAVCGCGVAGFGGGLVEGEGFFIVGFEAEGAAAVAIGEVEHCFGVVGCDELFEVFVGVHDVSLAGLVALSLVGDCGYEDFGCFD